MWPDCFSNVDNDSSRVYNMDETGLFSQALPSRTLARVDQRVQGSKTQKDRLTFATTICMDGSVLPLHAIGTSRMPRAVAAAHTTPAAILNGRWTHNRKAWMTTEVFCEWLLDLNHFFRQLVDDPSVPVVDIPVLKKHINMLHCLQFSRAAWDSLSPDTIKNCWHKAGFSVATPNEGTSDAGTVEVAAAPSLDEGELMKDLFELEELDATASSSVVPSDDTAEIVEMLQAERAEEHAQENDEQQDQTMPDPPSTPEIFVHSMCCIMLSMLPMQTTAYINMLQRSNHLLLTQQLQDLAKQSWTGSLSLFEADFGRLPVPYLHLSMSCDLCVQTFGTDHIVLLFIRQV